VAMTVKGKLAERRGRKATGLRASWNPYGKSYGTRG
jgi:hypothetical protein